MATRQEVTVVSAGIAMGEKVIAQMSPHARRSAVRFVSKVEEKIPRKLSDNFAQVLSRRVPELRNPLIALKEASDQQRFEEVMGRLKKIPTEFLPKHILLIPDGNRRFAQEHGLSDAEGHALGAQKLFSLLEMFRMLNIPDVTAWVWSQQNFKNRSEGERDHVFNITAQYLGKVLPHLMESEGRFIHVGRKDRLPKELKKTIKRVEKATKKNQKHTLRLAIDYGDVYEDARFGRGLYKEFKKNKDAKGAFKKHGDQDLREGIVEKIWEKSKSMSDVDQVMRTGIPEGEFAYLAGFGHAVRNSRIAINVDELPATPAYVFAERIEKFALMKMKGSIRDGK